MSATQKLELWAIVELFGHQKMAGLVTEQSIGVATFLRVDVPATTKQPGFTRLLNPSAIYAINPVTEEVVKIKAEQFQTKPIDSWDINDVIAKMKTALPATASVGDDNLPDDWNEEEDN
jgi:hypothetical protein